jgi:RNA polymerase sigma factor (sigma-70 family)
VRKTSPIPNELALRAQAGDKPALAAMVPRLQDKADFVSKRFNETHVDRNDLIQDALLAALEALPLWDPAKATFETHSQNVMRDTMLETVSSYYIGADIPGRTLRRYWKAMHETGTLDEAIESLTGEMAEATFVSIHAAVSSTVPAHLVEGVGYEGSVSGEDGHEDEFYYRQAPLQDDAEDDLVDRIILEEHLQELSPRDRFIIEGFMRQGTDTEIARDLGLDRSTVNGRRRAALAQLRESIEEDQDV